MQISWPVKLPFLVLYTDPGYRYVLFGEADRSLGWIYSRKPEMPDVDYRRLLAKFAALGYDPAQFRTTVQPPRSSAFRDFGAMASSRPGAHSRLLQFAIRSRARTDLLNPGQLATPAV